ncbi:MAG TPA: ABC transporter permease subunit [Cyclobacteriaceae bacterium]|nr:ABC transporter permease subunit [Cyclobacteriaceae bacterium]
MNNIFDLLKIDFKKLRSYRTFWVLNGFHFIVLGLGAISGMEFLKWLKRQGASFDGWDPLRIPLYHFPDIWQNMTWASSSLKFVLAIVVVVSVTNEFTYRTIRQNVIDGLSRAEFVLSKLAMNFVLALCSAVFVGLLGLIMGFIYSPMFTTADVLNGVQFIAAYFLDVFTFLSFALMISVLVQRSGLAIAVVLLAKTLESIVILNLPEQIAFMETYFPMNAMSNLIKAPFQRYIFREIQDYVGLIDVAIATAWLGIFNYVSFYKIKKADL